MSNRHNARRAAVQALYQWDLNGQGDEDIETQFSQIHEMANLDRTYLRQILQQVPLLDEQLESKISPHLDRSFASLDPVERAILRVATYELLQQQKVPTRVILNESIELAKVFGAEHSFRFINGVVDKIAAEIRSPE